MKQYKKFEQMVQMSRIHQVDGSKLDVSFLPQQEKISAEKLRERSTNLDESSDEGHIRDALEVVWPLPQRNTSMLLRGDFWPGNLLGKDGQLVAVIDWEDAALRISQMVHFPARGQYKHTCPN